MNKSVSRREFLDRSKQAGLGLAASVTLLGNAQSVWATPANNRIILAQIGCGGRGGSLAPGFVERGDCQYAYCCDPYLAHAEGLARVLSGKQKTPKVVQDFRKMLEDKSVDAVVVSTPDHWHAPATVWACHAGKDVYVEKPVSHNCWEGRKMVEAARKHKRIVQAGLQSRSAAYNRQAKDYLVSGKLGKIHFCRIYNQKEWANVPWAKDGNAPQGLDWDMWNGSRSRGPVQLHATDELAPSVVLLRRRHRQRCQPPDQPGAVAPGGQLSEERL